jgi:hypothetical protein
MSPARVQDVGRVRILRRPPQEAGATAWLDSGTRVRCRPQETPGPVLPARRVALRRLRVGAERGGGLPPVRAGLAAGRAGAGRAAGPVQPERAASPHGPSDPHRHSPGSAAGPGQPANALQYLPRRQDAAGVESESSQHRRYGASVVKLATWLRGWRTSCQRGDVVPAWCLPGGEGGSDLYRWGPRDLAGLDS